MGTPTRFQPFCCCLVFHSLQHNDLSKSSPWAVSSHLQVSCQWCLAICCCVLSLGFVFNLLTLSFLLLSWICVFVLFVCFISYAKYFSYEIIKSVELHQTQEKKNVVKQKILLCYFMNVWPLSRRVYNKYHTPGILYLII